MAVRIEARAEPIPGYRLIERLGGGGFGEVWRAEAPGGLHKAIKFVFGDLSNAAGDNGQRAEQELKALHRVQSVRHPYILSLERFDIIDGQLIIVMELADRNLWDRFRECRAQGLPGIPREELLRYMEEAAEALDLMNSEYQLQHLDIKPQNIFLVHNHIKVADFGLVKDLEGSQATITGGITPVYAAPETFDGKVSRFSDQYSLAILYQELLTGQRPFPGNNVRQLILQHLQGVPNVTPLPPGDREPIQRALSKEPNARFPTCRDLVLALRAGSALPKDEVGRMKDEAEGASSSFIPPPSSFPGAHSLLAPLSLPTRNGEENGLAGERKEGGRALIDGLVPPITPGPPTESIRGPLSLRSSPARPAPGPSGSPEAGTAQTPSPGTGATHPFRGLDQPVLRPEQVGLAARAPIEVTGSGTLFPALVLGLGQVGLTFLQRLREYLHTHVAPLSQLPHLRMMLLDTDPEVVRSATRGRPETALGASEVLLAPLNRPSHYLRPGSGRLPLESWLNTRMLYRIPRSQVTTGVRALGRLAFLDNYRVIARRLQMELEGILEPAALQSAARSTRLGVRTNRPRIYLVTSLAGGTGSGVFLDLAYTLRALLRQMGYDPPDIVGILLLPPVDKNRTRLLTLGNTYAALTELNYYASPGTTFSARYHEREAPLEDSGPPFSRCVILPLPDETDEVATQELVDLGGQFLARDLTSPLGRAADLSRAGLPSPPWEERGMYYQTFGMFQLAWPRHALLEVAARRMCQQLVQRWMSKDARKSVDVIQTWVQEQWQMLELGADSFIHRLQAEVIHARGRPADALFSDVLSQAWSSSEDKETARQGDKETARQPDRKPVALSAERLGEVLEELVELVGKPGEEGTREDAPGSLVKVLREGAQRLVREWSQKLASLPVRLIEDPHFRLAGAEEAIRQVVTTIEQTLQHHEPLTREVTQKAAELYDKLRQLAGPPVPGVRRPNVSAAALAEMLRAYPKYPFQSLILQHLATAFVSLRGHLSDELREVNFCRVRLNELLCRLEESPAADPMRRSWQAVSERPGLGRIGEEPSNGAARRGVGSIGRRLFLGGAHSLAEAVEQFLSALTPEHLLQLDVVVQEMLKEKFTALVHVCLSTGNLLKNVEAEMLAVAQTYAGSCLPPTSVAELFFEQHPTAEEAAPEVASYYDEAAPELSADGRSPRGGPAMAELCVVCTPPGEASERFRALLAQQQPETEMQHVTGGEDILIYRERNNLVLAELEQLGPVGQDAYAQMTATEHFTPHTRTDVEFNAR